MTTKPKKITIKEESIRALARARGLRFTADEIAEVLDFELDPSEFPTTIANGCIGMMTYGTSGTDLASVVLVAESGVYTVTGDADGILAQNLSDYRELIERAANFGQGLVFLIRLNRIQQVVVAPCVCPCTEGHVSVFPDVGIADPVDPFREATTKTT